MAAAKALVGEEEELSEGRRDRIVRGRLQSSFSCRYCFGKIVVDESFADFFCGVVSSAVVLSDFFLRLSHHAYTTSRYGELVLLAKELDYDVSTAELVRRDEKGQAHPSTVVLCTTVLLHCSRSSVFFDELGSNACFDWSSVSC